MHWWLDDVAEQIVARQEQLYRMRHECRKCGSAQIQLMNPERPAWWRCRSCKLAFIHEPDRDSVLLPTGGRVVDGLILVKRRDYEQDRNNFYEMVWARPETNEELQTQVLVSRVRDLMPKAAPRNTSYEALTTKRGAKVYIPMNYLPPRCHRMWRKGEISSAEAYAAAMYVYGVRVSFIASDVGTNFPQHEKVSTSIRVRSAPGYAFSSPVAPEIQQVLDYALISEGPLPGIPGVTAEGKTQSYHQGKMLLRHALREFAKTLAI